MEFIENEECILCSSKEHYHKEIHEGCKNVHPRCFRKFIEFNEFEDIKCPECNKDLNRHDINTIGGMNDNIDLAFVVGMGTEEQLTEKLNEGKSLDIFDSNGNTMLHVACDSYSDPNTLLKVLENTEHFINAKNDKGDTPLYLAMKNLQFSAVNKMIENKNIKIIENNKGLTFLDELTKKIKIFNELKDEFRFNECVKILDKLHKNKEGTNNEVQNQSMIT